MREESSLGTLLGGGGGWVALAGYPMDLAINEKTHIEPFRWLSGVDLKSESSNKSPTSSLCPNANGN